MEMGSFKEQKAIISEEVRQRWCKTSRSTLKYYHVLGSCLSFSSFSNKAVVICIMLIIVYACFKVACKRRSRTD